MPDVHANQIFVCRKNNFAPWHQIGRVVTSRNIELCFKDFAPKLWMENKSTTIDEQLGNQRATNKCIR